MLCDEKMRRDILSRLHGYRYEHSLGVERCAIALAKKYGGDPALAGAAGILHDITKHLSPQEQLNLCEKYGIIPCTVEKSEPKMLHGKTAAAIARREYHMPEARKFYNLENLWKDGTPVTLEELGIEDK